MASQKEIAKLIIDLQAQTAGIKQGLSEAQNRVAKFASTAKKVLGGIGIAIVTKKLAGLVKGSIDLADQMVKTGQKVGMTTESLSGLKYAAEISGIQFGAFVSGLRIFSKNMYDASNGVGEARDALEDLGVVVTDSNGNLKSMDKIIGEVADKISILENETKKTAIAQRIFGRSGAELLPMLNLGREGIKKLTDEAQRLGIVIDLETGRAAEQFNDNLRALGEGLRGIFIIIAKDLLPSLVTATNNMKEFVIVNRNFLLLPWHILQTIATSFKEIALATAAMIAIAFGPAIIGWVAALTKLNLALVLTVTQIKALGGALAFLLGRELGKAIDLLVYKLTRIDISGMQSVYRAQRDLSEGMQDLTERQEKVNQKLAELGFIGPDAMKKFNAAVKAGLVIWDKAAQKWVKAQKSFIPKIDKKTADENAKILNQLNAKIRGLQLHFIALTNPVKAANMALEDFINKTTGGQAGSAKFTGEVARLRQAFKALREEQERLKELEIMSKEQLSGSMSYIKDAMQEAEQQYELGKTTMSEYYQHKRDLVEKSYDAEIKALTEEAGLMNDSLKQREKMIEVYEKTDEKKRELAKLSHEEAVATKELLESVKEMRRVQTEPTTEKEQISAGYDEEILAIEDRYAEMYEKIKGLDNEKLAMLEEGLTKEKLLKEMAAAEDIQRTELTAQKELEIKQAHYRDMATLYGGMSQMMGDLYTMSGSKHKEFFKLQKAFSMAEAMMNAHGAATKAMAQGGLWGMAQAAFIYAKALIHVAAIGAQPMPGFAKGGLIMGGSGTKDDVPVMGTAGEYIMPKSAVKFYGLAAMDAIRGLVAPRNVLAPAMAVAGGGDSLSINVPVSIEGGNRLAGKLKDAIESTVRKVIEEHM
jgi:hypothetical protein